MICIPTHIQVAHCGGISELHRLASYTETYDVALAPHSPLGPIALAACIQVDLTAPNCTSLQPVFSTNIINLLGWRSRYSRNELAGACDLSIVFIFYLILTSFDVHRFIIIKVPTFSHI